MHDDRNYCFVLCCWEIKNLRDAAEFGDGAVLDYGVFFGARPDTHNGANDAWTNAMRSRPQRSTVRMSPF